MNAPAIVTARGPWVIAGTRKTILNKAGIRSRDAAIHDLRGGVPEHAQAARQVFLKGFKLIAVSSACSEAPILGRSSPLTGTR